MVSLRLCHVAERLLPDLMRAYTLANVGVKMEYRAVGNDEVRQLVLRTADF